MCFSSSVWSSASPSAGWQLPWSRPSVVRPLGDQRARPSQPCEDSNRPYSWSVILFSYELPFIALTCPVYLPHNLAAPDCNRDTSAMPLQASKSCRAWSAKCPGECPSYMTAMCFLEVTFLDARPFGHHLSSRNDATSRPRDRVDWPRPGLPGTRRGALPACRGLFDGDGRWQALQHWHARDGRPQQARALPADGGPAILEVAVPAWIMAILYSDPISAAFARSGEIRFEPESGL